MNRIPHLELPQFESSQIPERARERVETGAMMELELDIISGGTFSLAPWMA